MTKSKRVIRTYLLLTLLATLASSLIWGINTLFLLDAGLSNAQAFTANAFFTAGMVLFEIPTGIVADTWGRKRSYVLGTITLFLSTVFYYLLWVVEAPFLLWAVSSLLLGLGFTFFSGAVEAWLVDALNFTQYKGSLESVLSKGQIVTGIAMLSGSVAGGVIAQSTSLGVPFLIRAALLLLTFVAAVLFMKDLGFTPVKNVKPTRQIKNLLRASVDNGLKNPPVRWLMLAAPFTSGVGVYAFYALQPYLLELYGDPTAYTVAGLAAAIVAGAQILGGIAVPFIRKLFSKRTTILITGVVVSIVALFSFGIVNNFYVAVGIIVVWALVFAATMPIRQAFINGEIPSKQRATVLSFDALMGSAGGVVTQPVLGRAADVYSYGATYIMCSAIQVVALPFTYLARRENATSDAIVNTR